MNANGTLTQRFSRRHCQPRTPRYVFKSTTLLLSNPSTAPRSRRSPLFPAADATAAVAAEQSQRFLRKRQCQRCLAPPNLAFLDICSMDAFAEAQTGPCPLMTFARLVGALGLVATHVSWLDPRFAAQIISHAIRSSAALSSGVDAATAAPPAGDGSFLSSDGAPLSFGRRTPGSARAASCRRRWTCRRRNEARL